MYIKVDRVSHTTAIPFISVLKWDKEERFFMVVGKEFHSDEHKFKVVLLDAEFIVGTR